MRLLTLTVATAAAVTFVVCQTPPVLAQGHDDGAVGRPLQLDGGPSLGSDNRGISGRSQGTEPPTGIRSEKTQTNIEKTGESRIRMRSHTHVGWSSRARHRFIFHRRGHIFAFHASRHG